MPVSNPTTGVISQARAYRNTTQSIPNATWTTVVWDQEDWDDGGDYNTTNGLFTAPADGVYMVTAALFFASTTWTAGQRAALTVYKNGSQLARLDRVVAPGTTFSMALQGAVLVKLSTGDYIDVRAYQNSGASLDVYIGATPGVYNYFACKLLV